MHKPSPWTFPLLSAYTPTPLTSHTSPIEGSNTILVLLIAPTLGAWCTTCQTATVFVGCTHALKLGTILAPTAPALYQMPILPSAKLNKRVWISSMGYKIPSPGPTSHGNSHLYHQTWMVEHLEA